jgi:hypothetical protein
MQQPRRVNANLCLMALWTMTAGSADEPAQPGHGRLDDALLQNVRIRPLEGRCANGPFRSRGGICLPVAVGSSSGTRRSRSGSTACFVASPVLRCNEHRSDWDRIRCPPCRWHLHAARADEIPRNLSRGGSDCTTVCLSGLARTDRRRGAVCDRRCRSALPAPPQEAPPVRATRAARAHHLRNGRCNSRRSRASSSRKRSVMFSERSLWRGQSNIRMEPAALAKDRADHSNR